MPSTTTPVQLVHLEAIDESHHGNPFAIRARILRTYTDAPTELPQKLCLSTLLNDTNGALQPQISLWLQGRWRSALKPVANRDTILQIECPSITPLHDFSDGGFFSFCLQLDDDPSRSSIRRFPPSVYVLDSFLGVTAGVSYLNLDEGLTPPTIELRERFGRMRAAWETNTIVSHVNSRQRCAQLTEAQRQLTVSTKPQIHLTDQTSKSDYHLVGDIHDSESALSGNKLNVYGVVFDCRAPCTTRGPDLRSEIVILDESSVQEEAHLKTLQVYRFARTPSEGVPFRSFGDIVRVHRGKAENYVDGKMKEITQLRIHPYSTVLLWGYEHTSFEPIVAHKPTNYTNSDRNGVDHEPVHRITSYDRSRITELRKWVKDFFHPQYNSMMSTKAFRYSVSDPSAIPNHGFPIDVFCLVEEAFENEAVGGGLHLRVSDGAGGSMSVVSGNPGHYDIDKMGQYHFTEFIPCWHRRPRLPSWAFLKDIIARHGDGTCLLELTAGKPTSTVFFHPGVSMPAQRAAPSKQVNHVNQHVDTPAAATRLPVAPTVRVGNGRGNGNNGMSRSNATEVASEREVLEARKEQERSLPKLSENERAELTISCIRGNGTSLDVTSLADVLRDAQQGRQQVHRVRVDARVLLAPQEFAHACLATCRHCDGEYVRSVVNGGGATCTLECQKCGQRFYGRADQGLDWKFAMKFQLEDRSNGILTGWLEGDEGTLFFEGIVRPMCLTKNVEERMKLMTCLQHVLTANRWLDCCVRAYRYMDEDGVYHVACKIVDTKLFPLPREDP